MPRLRVDTRDLIIRTKRQERIAFLKSKEWTAPEIAVEMRLSVRTVQRYVANIVAERQPRKRGPQARRGACLRTYSWTASTVDGDR